MLNLALSAVAALVVVLVTYAFGTARKRHRYVDIAADLNPRRRRRLGASRPRAKQAEHWHALSAGLIGLSKPVVRSCGLPAKKSS